MVRGSSGLIASYFVVHLVLVVSLQRFVPGSDYVEVDKVGEPGLPIVRQLVIPLAVIALAQIGFLAWSRWTSPVLVEPRRLRARWWLVLLAFVVPVSVFLSAGWGDPPADYLFALTVATLLVGFTEELGFRGIVLHAAREVFGDERRAFLVSSVLFGCLHLGNIVLGALVAGTLVQVAATTVIGATFYVYRRTAGLIVVPMLLHAGWDWLLFVARY